MVSIMAATDFFAGGTVGKDLSDMSGASFAHGIRPVWIASYPRSGNTFLRILLQNFFRLPTYSVYNVEGQGFVDPSAATLETAPILPRNWRDLLTDQGGAETVLIKTHDLPRDDKAAIYLVRDGRAAIDSYYHYHQKFAFEKPSLTETIAGACQFGRWSDHYVAWQPQTRPNTLFLRYEDLVGQPEEIIPQIGEFLGQKPVDGRVPGFEELQQRFPVFFRRGRNDDFLRAWTPAQMSLFNELHGAVMQQLNYPLAQAGEITAGTAAELARSAAHWHEVYLDKLRNLGHSAATCQQLSKENERLQTQLQQISEEMEKKDAVLVQLLKSIWVKMGLTLGLLRRGNKANPRLATRSMPPETAPARKHAGANQTSSGSSISAGDLTSGVPSAASGYSKILPS
jgi:hypothetical protein